MKKFLSVIVVVLLVLGAISLVSCTKKGTTTPTPESTATPGYGFSVAGDTQGWSTTSTQSAEGAFTNPVQISTDGSITANGCLQVTANFINTDPTKVKGIMYVTIPATDLTNVTVSMYVKVPVLLTTAACSEYNWAIYFQDAANNYDAGGYSCFASTANTTWQHLSVPATSLSGTMTDHKAVTKIGLQIFRNTPFVVANDVVNGNVYLDDVTYK